MPRTAEVSLGRLPSAPNVLLLRFLLQVMLRELLDPKYAMFKYDEETRRLWFNSDSLEAQEEFELVGMLLGIAIYNG